MQPSQQRILMLALEGAFQSLAEIEAQKPIRANISKPRE
jgi:hypothetical protein